MKHGMVSDMVREEDRFNIIGVIEAAPSEAAAVDSLLSATVLLDDEGGVLYTLRVESQAFRDPAEDTLDEEPEPIFLYPGQINEDVLRNIVSIPKSILSKYVVKQDIVLEPVSKNL
jgi:hypothetical protein